MVLVEPVSRLINARHHVIAIVTTSPGGEAASHHEVVAVLAGVLGLGVGVEHLLRIGSYNQINVNKAKLTLTHLSHLQCSIGSNGLCPFLF